MFFSQTYKNALGFSVFRYDIFALHLAVSFTVTTVFGVVLHRLRRKLIKHEHNGGGGPTGTFHRVIRYAVFNLLPCILLSYAVLDPTLPDACQWLVATSCVAGLFLSGSLQPFALTGGIACGKSTAVNRMKLSKKVSVVDLDKIAHSLYDPSVPGNACSAVAAAFGPGVMNPDGSVDRKRLRESGIFNDAAKRRQLNAITHPLIRKKMLWDMFSLRCLNLAAFVVVDCPLLFESPILRYIFSAVIVVDVNRETQLKRLKGRNPDLDEKQCNDMIDSQMPLKVKVKLADVVLDNSGTEDRLNAQVDELVRKMQRNRWPASIECNFLGCFFILWLKTFLS